MALPACNHGATGSYRGITVNSLGNAGVYRHEPWLHRAALQVLRGEPGINRRLAGPGLYWGNVGKVRTQFIFYEMCPGASRYTGCPASRCTVAPSAQ